MEYQKITNFLDNASHQPSKFRTKNWFEINLNPEVDAMLIVKLNSKLQ